MGIRNNFKSIRHKLEIDEQYKMADLLHIPPQQYSRFEKNRPKPQPSLETVLIAIEQLKRFIPDIKIEDIVYRVIDESPEE